MFGKFEKNEGFYSSPHESARSLRRNENKSALCRVRLKKILLLKRRSQRIQRHKDISETLTREMKIRALRNMHKMGVPGIPDELDELINKLDELDEEKIDELYLASSFGDY